MQAHWQVPFFLGGGVQGLKLGKCLRKLENEVNYLVCKFRGALRILTCFKAVLELGCSWCVFARDTFNTWPEMGPMHHWIKKKCFSVFAFGFCVLLFALVYSNVLVFCVGLPISILFQLVSVKSAENIISPTHYVSESKDRIGEVAPPPCHLTVTFKALQVKSKKHKQKTNLNHQRASH